MADTKQAILMVALNLFSQKGFSSVSIRDICKQVGIKESSVYYHFKNKQDIFDTLQNQFLSTSEQYTSMFQSKMNDNSLQKIDYSFYQKIGKVYIENFLLDDFNNLFIRALNIERFSNENARKLYDEWMFDYPLKFQAGIFSYLMKAGILPVMDSCYMAVQYYAPIYLYYERYLLSGEVTEERKNLFREHVYKHFQEFMKE